MVMERQWAGSGSDRPHTGQETLWNNRRRWRLQRGFWWSMTSRRFGVFYVSTSRRRGTKWSRAGDGLDALSLLRRGGIDLALVDVMLPGLDGFELVRRIRTESGIPIMLITARGEEAADRRSRTWCR